MSKSKKNDVKEIPALGHNWNDGTFTKEPTYTEKGIKSFTCKNDKTHIKVIEVPTLEVLGDESGVTGAKLRDKDGRIFDIQISGFFLAIGHHPNSELFSRWLETDANGYIVTHDGQKTSVEGVFAAGDVQDPHYRQAITAAASGCRAALDVKNYLDK